MNLNTECLLDISRSSTCLFFFALENGCTFIVKRRLELVTFRVGTHGSIIDVDRIHIIFEFITDVPETRVQPVAMPSAVRLDQHHPVPRPDQYG